MQKVKDRQAKLQSKKEEKIARLEQVEEAERNKKAMYGWNGDDDSSSSSEEEDNGDDEDKRTGKNVEKETKIASKGENVMTFQDSQTQAQFGGQVVVTTTFGIDSDEDEPTTKELKSKKRTNRDEQQIFAGSVQKYMTQLKGNLPSKRDKFQSGRGKMSKKGQHGAEGMKGMGTASDLKVAQKTLEKFRGGKGGKGRAGADRGGAKGKGKKGRGRR
jgi:hypothetical protein